MFRRWALIGGAASAGNGLGDADVAHARYLGKRVTEVAKTLV